MPYFTIGRQEALIKEALLFLIRKVGGVILINDKEGAGFRMQGRREANEKTLREARGVLTVPPPCISVLTTNTLLKTTNNIDRHK